MKNEFGTTLDRNGYAPSILNAGDCCYMCHGYGDLVRHEIFQGVNRQKSKEYGLWVTLHPRCHDIYHSHRADYRWMTEKAQMIAMTRYEWTEQDFIDRFGKNYM